MRSILFFIVCMSVLSLEAQKSLNHYKYVVVPERFDFLKSNNQYQLNSLTAFLLSKNNFDVISNSSYPKDFQTDRCLGLTVNVLNLKGFLSTKLQVEFRNCKNEVIFLSDVGTSKIKDFKPAYHQALRSAFESVSEQNYTYTSGSVIVADETTVPPKTLAKKTVETPKVHTPAAAVSSSTISTPTFPEKAADNSLRLVVTTTGFDLINSRDIRLFSAHATLFDGVYILENTSGILYQRGKQWVRESIEQGKTVIESLNVVRP